jgi:hypothetical protein
MASASSAIVTRLAPMVIVDNCPSRFSALIEECCLSLKLLLGAA